jgi:type VI secretion system protein ImpF
MPRVDPQKPLLPSVLDRLIDNEPDVSTEPQWQRAQSLRQFELGVLRDVEAMLNTRQSRPGLGEEFKEVRQSVLTFGLPDLTATGVGSSDDAEQLRRAVELALARFEPRLRQVSVRIRDRENENDRTLRMVIEGLLWVEPDPQPITFDTLVQPLSGQCTVQPR